VRARVLSAVAAVALGSGCVHVPPGALGVPAVAQESDYSCGPATLTALLRYWQGYAGGEQALYGPLHTTEKDGTEAFAMEAVARAHGLHAESRHDVTLAELRAALAAGQTVILDLQAWRDSPHPWVDDWDDGHYVVLVAMDARRLYTMDPATDGGYSFIDIAELLPRWHDFETRDGKITRYAHMAIFISGERPQVTARPGRAEKMR
jgi:predicted double-glycine peptidase